jgi:hypothetical protein
MTDIPYTRPLSLADRLRYEFPQPSSAYVVAVADGPGAAGDLLRGRHESLDRVASGVGALVAERQRLSEEVLGGIDRDDLELSNLMLNMYRPNIALTDNPAYTKLKVERMRLGRERRQELVSCWRDTALLGKDLVELVEKAEEARRTSTMLGGDGS